MKFIIVTLLFFCILLISYIFLQRCFLIITVEMESMIPALQPGDRVLVIRCFKKLWLRKGNIVLLWPWPEQISPRKEPKPYGLIPYIKRISGLPGEKITIRIEELSDHHQQKHHKKFNSEGKREIQVPENYYFVTGDFPIAGVDSRTFGPVPQNGILGLVIMKLPLNGRK